MNRSAAQPPPPVITLRIDMAMNNSDMKASE